MDIETPLDDRDILFGLRSEDWSFLHGSERELARQWSQVLQTQVKSIVFNDRFGVFLAARSAHLAAPKITDLLASLKMYLHAKEVRCGDADAFRDTLPRRLRQILEMPADHFPNPERFVHDSGAYEEREQRTDAQLSECEGGPAVVEDEAEDEVSPVAKDEVPVVVDDLGVAGTLTLTVDRLETLHEPLMSAVRTLLDELAAGARPTVPVTGALEEWSLTWQAVPTQACTLREARELATADAAQSALQAADLALIASLKALKFQPGNEQAVARLTEVQQEAYAASVPLEAEERAGFTALLRVLHAEWPDDADVQTVTERFGLQVLMAANRLTPEPATEAVAKSDAVTSEQAVTVGEGPGPVDHDPTAEVGDPEPGGEDVPGDVGNPEMREDEPAGAGATEAVVDAAMDPPPPVAQPPEDVIGGGELLKPAPAAPEPTEEMKHGELARDGLVSDQDYLARYDAAARDGDFATAYWYAVAGQDDARARAARLLVGAMSSDMTVGSPNPRASSLAVLLEQDLTEASASLSETIAAALVPTALLLPPYSEAALALNAAASRLGNECPAFVRLANTLTYERGSGLHTVEAPLLLAARDQARADLEEFRDRAPSRSTRFHRATEVWRELIRQQGLVGSLVAQALEQPASDEVRRALAELAERGIERVIKDTDSQLNPIQARRQGIIAGAKQELAAMIERFLDLVRAYVSAEESVRAIDKSSSHNTDLIEDLIGSLPVDPASAQGFGCMTAGVAHWLRTRLVPSGTPTITRSEAELLARPLVGAFELDRTVDGDVDSRQVTVALLDAQQARSFEDAFTGYVARYDFVGLAELLEVVGVETPASSAALEERERRARGDAREALNRALDRTRNALSRAVAATSLTEAEAQEYQDLVERVSRDTNPHFRHALALLGGIDEDLARRQQDRLNAAAARLAALPDVHEAARTRVANLLDSGDLLSAEEFLAQLSNGATSLPEEDAEDRTLEGFWPVVAAAADKAAGPTWFADRRAEGRIGEVALPHPGAPARVQTGLLAWEALSRQVRPQGWDQMLREVLIAVGFENVKLGQRFSPGRGSSYNVFEARYDGYALIPTFGSAARGAYGIFLCWERKTIDGLLQAVRAEQGGQPRPTIVLYFQTLKPAERRTLSEQCRRKGLPNIVIDHAAMAYLGIRQEARFDGLMHVCLPFAGANPYTPFVLGDVPREMFYGRTGELQDVQDPNGPLFVYGGRQLGKSALLKTAMAEFGRFDEHHASVYLDLKAEGIGEWHKADDLWRVLVPPLQSKGVLPEKTSRQASPDVITALINEWLAADERRHLLLLLDESDAFLDQDSQPRDAGRGQFKNVYMLKNLMNQSQRRFKPVFAGLHQVQRFHKESNGPMAHVGTEIPVGPLPPAEAYKLVVRPLEAIGYRFASPDVVWRLLSHTNYQASLIQLFCKELVNDLKNRRLGLTEPPTVIDAATVDKVYENKELRNQIAQRFDWTIQLDNRYRVIALVAAWLNLADAETVASVGVLRDQCSDFWPAGFEGVSPDEFRALLDEMVGLGVLVRNRADHYGIRSPNVIRLLGSKDEIERKLLECGSLELPTVFDPARYRRQLGGERSPLTEAQAARILTHASEPTVVVASPALGADRIAAALTEIGGDSIRVFPTSPDELTATVTRLARIRSSRHILLDGRGLDDDGLRTVLGQIGKTSRQQITASVLLDPATRIRVTLPEVGVRELVLEPWSDAELRAVEPEADVPLNADVRSELLTLTGGWPEVLDGVLANGRRAEVSSMLTDATQAAQAVVTRGWDALADRIGIPRAGAERQVLDAFLAWEEPLGRNDLADLLPPWDPRQVTTLLDHLVLAGAVHPVSSGENLQSGVAYRVNPLVARTIKTEP